MRTKAPIEIKEFIENNEAYSRSGKQHVAEGGNYITENENRALKSHLPPGVPTLKSWIEASRCDKHLKLNHKTVFNRLGIIDPVTAQTSTFNFEYEIQMLRRQIRSSKIFDDPFTLTPLLSIDRNMLNQTVVNFYYVMQDNYDSYLTDRSKSSLKPIFVTHEGEKMYLDVNNWTISKIRSESANILDQFADQELAQMYRESYKKNNAKWKKDQQHISFYNEVKEALSSVDKNVDVDVDTFKI